MFEKRNKKLFFNKLTQQTKMNSVLEKPFAVTEQNLRSLFLDNGDITFQTYTFSGPPSLQVLFVFCEGMVNSELINKLIIERLHDFIKKLGDSSLSEKLVKDFLYVPNISIMKNNGDIVKDLFSGKMLIHFIGYGFAFTTDIAKRPQRTPEEGLTEVTIKGPRDNFIEDLAINIALIRKRLRTTSLHIKKFEIGKRSSTSVALLYVSDIAKKDIVDGISQRLQKVDVDGIFSGDQLMELIEKPALVFPRHHYTARPDFALHSLLKGRCLILIDGVCYSLIVPGNLFFLFKTSEDAEYISAFSSFERILRLFSTLISIFTPGFYIAVTTFHQDQLPGALLANVVSGREGLPFPSALEAILMLLLFELFQEAGLRVPTPIGPTLSVFGALIIGDAAIRAGLTSPAQVVVISAALIATYALGANNSLAVTVGLLRFFTLLLSSLLGLYGFFMAFYFVLTYLCNIRTFGVPYLEFSANLTLTNILNSVLRLPAKIVNTRPQMFSPKDPTAGGDNDTQ